MKTLRFDTLYIYEHKKELAKRVDFTKGINIITSDQLDGNDKGKSIIMKSL